ncbi:MAG: hypothetical protein V7638_4822 [Acidobacteriota bacterium]|jgi:uncharacterized phage protein gp47/JayE
MIVRPTIVVDDRDQDAFLQELDARRRGYVKEWSPGPRDPGFGIQLIAARYLQAVVNRLQQSPEKNKLAFLDLLGQRLSPARAARTPVVFQLANDVSSSLAPAGTAVAAPPPPGSNQQMVFETETEVGLTAGKLVQVFSLWPGRDEYINHSVDFINGKPFTFFDRDLLVNTEHIVYLSHPVLLNLSGNVVLAVEFQLLHPAGEQLQIAWEYWDGKIWREFASVDTDCEPATTDPNDATNGLTSSGVVKLIADCATADKTTVNGVQGYWIRGRLIQPLPPDPAKLLPEVESIRLSSLVSQPMIAKLTPKTALGERAISEFAAPVPQLTIKGSVLNEAGQPLSGAEIVASDPANPNFGQPSTVSAADGKFTLTVDNLGTKNQLLFEVAFFDVRSATLVDLPPKTTTVDLTLKLSALPLTKAFNDGTKLDTTKPFYPFGQQPQPGTVFYFNNKEIFSKPAARFRMHLPRTSAPSDQLRIPDVAQRTDKTFGDLNPQVIWEYWNGREWTELLNFNRQEVQKDFSKTEILDFRVPIDLVPTSVNDDADLWMRARLVSGGYGFFQQMSFASGANSPATNNFTVIVTQPPVLAAAVLSYSWQYGPFHPERVITFNDFQYEDHTYEATWPGSSFPLYKRVADSTPAVYLGFDKKPPTASLGIFFDIVETATGAAAPAFTWEYWDGFAFGHVAVDDETAQLTSPGILSFIAASDNEALARFGTSLYWLRGRLKEDGPPPEVALASIYPNAVWALQRRTFTDVSLGKATGQPSEVFRITQTPVIPGERLEVLELSGARANVEWRLIALELSGGDNEIIRKLEALLGKENLPADLIEGDLRLRRDKQKRVTEVWVRWYSQPNLFFSAANDRDYAIDRARGLVFFGDGVNGRTLPIDATVNVRRFESGGGADGNVAPKAIAQLQGAVPGVQAVFNPRAAEGGSDGETLEAFSLRAPASVRHRGRALTTGDYEAMVREASSAIAVVKAISNRNPDGRTLPGWLTIFIIPESQDPRPYPSRGLREEITAYLAERAPAGLGASNQLYVTGPTYFPVDISATIAPVSNSLAGSVEKGAREALNQFLHPLHGGPAKEGWDFGRGVYLSDVATVLESVAGLDHAELIQLLVADELRGDFVEVPPDQIVVAGTIRLKLKGAEE